MNSDLDILDSIDCVDPISLSIFWTYDNMKKKILIHPEPHNLIRYKNSLGLIHCFEKESLEYMKAYNIIKHPVTNENIPSDIFDRIDCKILDNNLKTIDDIAFNIFQKFTTMSIFIDSQLFIDLNKSKLLKLNYELSDMFKTNFSNEQIKKISNIELFNKNNSTLDSYDINDIRTYLLEHFEILLDVKDDGLKYMCNYILVGALSVIIPEINSHYSDFNFSFTPLFN